MALSFLALHADEHWPFEQFQKALADPGMDGPKPEARWQMLNASLNGIKRVIRRFNRVMQNGEPLPTSFVSNDELRAMISPDPIAKAGMHIVTLF